LYYQKTLKRRNSANHYRSIRASLFPVRELVNQLKWLILAILGLCAGSLSSLLGIGGGIVIVPVLVWLGMPMKQAVGTSIAVIVPTALSGAVSHSIKGNVVWSHVLIIAVTAVIGAHFSVYAVNIIPEPILKKLFAALMLFMAVKMSIS
jgi:uncharacterized membrane protein YfcA